MDNVKTAGIVVAALGVGLVLGKGAQLVTPSPKPVPAVVQCAVPGPKDPARAQLTYQLCINRARSAEQRQMDAPLLPRPPEQPERRDSHGRMAP